MIDLERWDILIPFHQSGAPAAASMKAFIQIPNFVDHGLGVSIQNMGALISVTGQVVMEFNSDGMFRAMRDSRGQRSIAILRERPDYEAR